MKIKLQTILSLIAILALVAQGLTLSALAQETPAALNFTMKSIDG